MESNNPNPTVLEPARERRPARRARYHQRAYLGLLIFVVLVGLPIVGVPAVRHRLHARVETLRAAIMGVPVVQAAATGKVGENHEPFPREYERPKPQPSYLAQVQKALPRRPDRVAIGGGVSIVMPKAEPQVAAAAPAAAQAAPDAGAEPQYKKGQSEQEAYDFLVISNQTLAGMIKGSDPALKFQDWGAANMGENSFYVMITFTQAADNQVRKYIWSVKVSTKEVLPLSSYARSISK